MKQLLAKFEIFTKLHKISHIHKSHIGLFHLKSTPPLWKKDNGIPIPAGLDVKSSWKIFVSLMQVPAEHCGRF